MTISDIDLLETNNINNNLYLKTAEDLLMWGTKPALNNKDVLMSSIGKLPSAKELVESPLAEELFSDGLVTYAKNTSYFDKYLPEFGSLAQGLIPRLVQMPYFRKTLANLVFPVAFPIPAASDAPTKTVRRTIRNPKLTLDNKCPRCLESYWYSPVRRSGKYWISTGVYAKQGQLVKLTIPEGLVGKFDIQLGCHTDDIMQKNLNKWSRGKPVLRPGRVTQTYPREILNKETYLLSPYGGLIYIMIEHDNSLGDFDLTFENAMESPLYIHGISNNEEWQASLKASKAPMVEIEVPGLVLSITRNAVDKMKPDMEVLANLYKSVMQSLFDLQGYKNVVAQRYLYDIDITSGIAHAGYPAPTTIEDSGLVDQKMTSLACFGHEMGHNIQDSRWTASKMTEVTNTLFMNYIQEKHFGKKDWRGDYRSAEDFRNKGRSFSNLRRSEKRMCFRMVLGECGWDGYKKFFKYYQDHIPAKLNPNTDENKHSTIVRVLSLTCNRNLVPFFQWWKWPVLEDTIEATKDLPEWKGIIHKLNTFESKYSMIGLSLSKNLPICSF